MKKYEVKLKLTRNELMALACLLHYDEDAFQALAEGFNSRALPGRKIKPLTKEQAMKIADVLYEAEYE